MRAPGSRGRRARVVGLGIPEAAARGLREPQHIRCKGRRRFPESLAGAVGGQRLARGRRGAGGLAGAVLLAGS